jgi:hypothetical protein
LLYHSFPSVDIEFGILRSRVILSPFDNFVNVLSGQSDPHLVTPYILVYLYTSDPGFFWMMCADCSLPAIPLIQMWFSFHTSFIWASFV